MKTAIQKENDHHKRHELIYRFSQRIILPWVVRKYDYETDMAPDMDEPYIVMANHTTEKDMFFVGSAFRKPMYFVCGEHLLRSPIGGFIKWVGNPISAPRGGNMLPVVREILKRVRAGYNVAIFPEGCRSFNGETLKQSVATAKMVKAAGCGLITYRTHGGYFIAPRWAYTFRKGKAWGEVANVYSSEQIKNMTVGELTDRINEDIYENAYLSQAEKMVPYRIRKGKGLAEGLENYLFICPECGGYDTLATKNDSIYCMSCGAKCTIDEYGYLSGDMKYKTVIDWGKWTEDEYSRAARENELPLPFVEENITLYRIDSANHKRIDLCTDTLRITGKEFRIGAYTFPYKDMHSSSLLFYGKTVLFEHEQGYFGMTGPAFHAWKADKIWAIRKAATEHGKEL